MNNQGDTNEGRVIADSLSNKDPVPFLKPKPDGLPNSSGIYLLSDRRTGGFLYVGYTKKGFQDRMIDHWRGTEQSDLAKELVGQEEVKTLKEAREWIKANVVIRWMTSNELGMDIRQAERLVIRVLQPRFNKRIS